MKKNIWHTRKLLAILLLLAGVLLIGKTSAKAAESRYYASISNLVQEEWGTNTAGITWKLEYEGSSNTVKTAGYNIYLGTDYSNVALVGTSSSTSYRFTGLEAGKKYYVKVVPCGEDGSEGSYRSFALETMPAQVKNFHQDVWWFFIKKLDVTWDRIDTADKIVVSLYNSKGKRVGKAQTLPGYSTSASFSKMKDEVYTVKIQAFRTAGGKTWQTPVSSIKCFNQARITYSKVVKNKLTVKWGKVKGATGYDIYVSTKPKKGYKKVKSVKAGTSKVTLSRFNRKAFNPKKTYYIYVETKIKNGKKINKSSALYYWNTKDSSDGYLN